MKLYFSKGACSLVVRIIIHEIGLTADYEEVDLKTKKTKNGDDFLKINPKGAVPTLMTDKNQILTENSVIQQFLADTNHATQLLPPMGDFNRYRVLELLNFISTDIHKGFGPLFNPKIPAQVKEEIAIPNLISKFNFLDSYLQQKKYLMGDTFTLPDAYLFVMLYWLSHFKMDMATWSNLSSYFNELKNRKSIQQAMTEEGLK